MSNVLKTLIIFMNTNYLLNHKFQDKHKMIIIYEIMSVLTYKLIPLFNIQIYKYLKTTNNTGSNLLHLIQTCTTFVYINK